MTTQEQDVVPADITRPVISARDVRVWYGTTRGAIRAVDGVSFDLEPGETLGLVGESGCGKSTLGRGLMGLLPEGAKRDGEVLYKGDDILSMSPKESYRLRGSELGMIFQEPLTRLNPLMRISEHFEETISQHEPDLSKHETRQRALDVLRLMGIPPTRYKSYPHEFSGGMRQRLMIALALVLRPSFIVADEPTTALDVLVEAQIISILNDLRRNFETSLLLITHNLGVVAESCDRVAVMYAGRIVEQGTVRQVFGNPQHPYTQELLRSTISLSTTGLNFIPGAPPDLVDPPTGCRFHPRCPSAMKVCWTMIRCRRDPRSVLRWSAGWPAPRTSFRTVAPRTSSRRSSPLPTKPDHEVDRVASSETVVDIKDLSVHFDLQGSSFARLFGRDTGTVKAVDGINLTMHKGEVVGLVGESGSGKSTLGRALLGLAPATRGSITFEGNGHREDVPEASCARSASTCRWSSRTPTPR